ncbi:PREDICTED: inhibin beta B chain [Rhagoletis zephyria]|uniref:inhibin beta B chain n=1 Tax=Rhagoletis zephyria TaxID=28612 RepID=UPI0008117C54|nr:PREDICTED: inhibin beta B chain [Rhagoletis zephyria]XP_017477018.1 PREDICTED: inhibin beta B chain [Rhagoletis zephyria]XP_036320880.1 inhibin beta B chain [Rhagoletis pomonella]XP_036320881.1 inhibin beta B chain [Rhagoletis pomonella]XP_036320882.1 inhibin beta B chain [Rhagoletis pomonella]
MVRYLISFMLIAFVALDHSIIYGRQHSDIPASNDSDSAQPYAHYVPPPYEQTRHLFHVQSPQQIHKRSHRVNNKRPRAPKARRIRQSSWHENVPPDAMNSEEERAEREEAAAALRRYIHIQRHMAHQEEHLRHHKEEYHRTARQLAEEQQEEEVAARLNELQAKGEAPRGTSTVFSMRMPRIWQHLGATEDLMLGDAPRDYNDESQSGADVSLSLSQSLSVSDELDDSVAPSNATNNNWLEVADNEQNEAAQKKKEITVKSGCPKCESSRRVEHISEEELTQLRIEYVKQQILEKLRLKERPNVSAVGLPKPIYEGTTIEEEEDDSAKNKDLDDYYARTSKKFIFLQREKRECQRLGTNSSMCFSFKIDDADADGFDVNTAVLWLFKSRTKRSRRNNSTRIGPQTIVVSEVQQNTDPKYLPIVKTIAIQSVDVQDEWMKIDIEWPIKRWFGNHDLSHLIHISCRTCDMASMEKMISVNKDYRPFIMVDTQNRRRASRQKRGINCTDGVTECCREKLYISFDEIGWGDWIIQPRGYDAYFCRGSCGSVASVAQSATHHSAFLQKVALSRRNRGSKPLELIPCCTAKQYSSLQLVFMDSNNTATQKTFPNMVVESCGCR